VTVHGIVAPGVTIEREVPSAVQIRPPSKAIPLGASPRLLATVVTAPGAWLGSIMKSLPRGEVLPETKIRPMATAIPAARVAPVQVASSVPSLPRTRETELLPKFATQRSAPSDWTYWGLVPTVVIPRTVSFCGVQNCLSAARRLPRFKTPSTDLERN